MNVSETMSKPLSPTPAPSAELTKPARLLRGLVVGYQHFRAGRPSPCRFYPSCSQYASEALEVHGAWRGSYLALRRVVKCNPFGPHGADPVPTSRKMGAR